MTEGAFTIGRLARETGCKIPTIRYYEDIGLLPRPPRSRGNQRLYGKAHLDRLSFIRHCRELGFTQTEIRDLLQLRDHPDADCDAVTAIARQHLEEVKRRINSLRLLQVELRRMLDACKGGRVAECRIIEALADHAHRPRPPLQ
jgi:DNA-binding transcriptional MerR regulator